MSIAILFNPTSGRGRALKYAQQIKAALQLDGVKTSLLPTDRGDAEHWLLPVLHSKRKAMSALIVCGGDGAVRLVASSAAAAEVPIWHAPCGTENLFARAFGMRRNVEQLRAALRVGRVQRVDLGYANGSPFVLMGSMGIDARIVHALTGTRRTGPISHLSYVAPVLECLRSWSAPQLAWEIDGEREELGGGTIVVGNFREYGAQLNPASRATFDDGLLDAVFFPMRSAFAAASWAPILRCRLSSFHPHLRERRAAAIRVFANVPEMLQLDGDPAGAFEGEREVRFTVRSKALGVLMPA